MGALHWEEFILAREIKVRDFFIVFTRERKMDGHQRIGDFLMSIAVISPNVNLIRRKCLCLGSFLSRVHLLLSTYRQVTVCLVGLSPAYLIPTRHVFIVSLLLSYER